MADFLQKLPTVLILAVLVGIFVALQSHNPVSRGRLWIAAWGLIFSHFLAQVAEPMKGLPGLIASAIDTSALLVAGVVFVVSVSLHEEKPRHRYGLLLLLGVPAVLYCTLDAFDVWPRWPYLLCLAGIFGGGARYALASGRKLALSSILMSAAVLAAAVWAFESVWQGHHDIGVSSLLGIAFLLPAVLFWHRYSRWTAGVMTTVGGFLAWGLVFPIGYLTDILAPKAPINPELWNVPKFFVAFGMILTVLEDKSAAEGEARAREHALNFQLQRFADITSRLLRGADVRGMSAPVARTIAEAANFRSAAIFLSDDNRNLYLAGHSGLAEDERGRLERAVEGWTLDSLRTQCDPSCRFGQNSYRLATSAEFLNLPLSAEGSTSSAIAQNSREHVLVPLVSGQQRCAGFILLEASQSLARITPEAISKVELLAADLAMAAGNSVLQRQLIRSEKLAGIGQLVAGVAHELNNPLTAVLGYASLLSGEMPGESPRRWLESLAREADRMKRIIQNLLRFSRQNKPERKCLDLASIAGDTVLLCEYQIGRDGINVELDLQPDLPPVLADEDQMKQVLLNLLKNAMDAVEASGEKRISIATFAANDRVVLQVSDTGPGFRDLDHAFDPFFTTKPVGRGTGLGLSICYGILKEHGGEIQAHNLRPRGARVSIELPAAPAQQMPLGQDEQAARGAPASAS